MIAMPMTYIVGAVIFVAGALLLLNHRRVRRSWVAAWDWVSSLAPSISRQKIVAFISLVGSIVAVVATYYWLTNTDNDRAEPTSQFVIALAWAIVALIQILIPSDQNGRSSERSELGMNTIYYKKVLRCLQKNDATLSKSLAVREITTVRRIGRLPR